MLYDIFPLRPSHPVRFFLVLDRVDILFDLPHVDARHGVHAVEDVGDLLQSGALGLDVEEVDEDELEEIPDL